MEPLQVIIIRNKKDEDAVRYEEAVLRAFQGGKSPAAYLASGEDLSIQVCEFETAPPATPPEMLDSFCHTQIVVLVDDALLEGEKVWSWLGDASDHVRASGGRHSILLLTIEERMSAKVRMLERRLSTIQILPAHSLGEFEMRSGLFSLLVLHQCRVLLSDGLPPAADGSGVRGHLRLFISHAKVDGLPLAQSLRYLISTLPWLKSFYDAVDLPPGCDWTVELERGVSSSVIVMLRTNVYDDRHWCQQEVRWSDEYATPAVMVDARTELSYSSVALPYDRAPSVRIPDGNLIRILFAAIRESLRFLFFARRVEEMKRVGVLPSGVPLYVFALPPSAAALLRLCTKIPSAARSKRTLILYPDPALPTGQFEAANALVRQFLKKGRLVTPNTLAVRPAV